MTILDVQQPIERKEALLVFDNAALAAKGASFRSNYDAAGGQFGVSNLGNDRLDSAYRSVDFPWVRIDAAPQLVGGTVDRDDFILWAGMPIGYPTTQDLRIVIDLGRERQLDFVSPNFHNNYDIPWSAQFYDADPDVSGALLWDSGPLSPIIRPTLEELGFENLFEVGGPTETDLVASATSFLLRSFAMSPSVVSSVRFVQITVHVTLLPTAPTGGGGQVFVTKNPSAYFQMSYPLVGRSFQPELNFVYPHRWGVLERSLTSRTDAGSLRGRRRKNLLSFTCRFPNLSRDEALVEILNRWVREEGTLSKVFFWPEPQLRRFFYSLSMIGNLTEVPAVGADNIAWHSVDTFTVTETT